MVSVPFDRFKIPHKPGVYIFKGADGKVVYVGKAIDLFSRVSSYFSSFRLISGDAKTARLVENIKSCETVVVESELEALILEANLIKKYLPPYNIRLTDDKDYLYIKITSEPFPKIITARKKELLGAKLFFGPFPSARVVRDTLKKLRRVFPWCANPPKGAAAVGRPCFYYHLGLCPGPCAGKISKMDYNRIISKFSKFMQGRKDDVKKGLQKEMEIVAKRLEFERAQSLKKALGGLEYLTQSNRAQIYLENPNFVDQQRELALQSLQADLRLPSLPGRIEAYDISNIQGTDATGSMVVLTNGEIDKSQYRKFKIKISGRPNDVGMHREMIKRRLNHPEWPLPGLVIVDGGRGQARAAHFEILNLKFEIPVFGLAKRLEWLYPPEGEVVKLRRSSLSLRLLQKIRDEAHRFALKYHRKLRSKSLLV